MEMLHLSLKKKPENLEKIPRNFLRMIGGFESTFKNNQFQGLKLFIPSGLRGYLDRS